jgi:Holliday junction resolvase-like predicted endonuclease
VRAARRWLAAHPGRGRSVRFDVVSVLGDPPDVTWIKAAFDLQGPA